MLFPNEAPRPYFHFLCNLDELYHRILYTKKLDVSSGLYCIRLHQFCLARKKVIVMNMFQLATVLNLKPCSHTVILLLQVSSCCSIKSPVGVLITGCHSHNVYQWVLQLAFNQYNCHYNRKNTIIFSSVFCICIK